MKGREYRKNHPDPAVRYAEWAFWISIILWAVLVIAIFVVRT